MTTIKTTLTFHGVAVSHYHPIERPETEHRHIVDVRVTFHSRGHGSFAFLTLDNTASEIEAKVIELLRADIVRTLSFERISEFIGKSIQEWIPCLRALPSVRGDLEEDFAVFSVGFRVHRGATPNHDDIRHPTTMPFVDYEAELG